LAVLVAGGAGFVGANTVRFSHLASCEVVVYEQGAATTSVNVVETAWAWHSSHIDGHACK
jgi:UDP-glucose 4-epimerase